MGPMRFLPCLLLLGPALLLRAAPPNPDMPEKLTGFRWATRDAKTGQVTMILAGESAQTAKGGPIEVAKPQITLYDRTAEGAAKPVAPSTTQIAAERATYRRDSGLLSMSGHVVVKRSDGTTVKTEALEWDEPKGRFWTDEAAEITDGDSTISGAGLKGEMAEVPGEGRTLDRITLARDVKTALAGAELSGLDDLFTAMEPASAGSGGVTISCGGAMVYQRRAGSIDYTEGVTADDGRRRIASRSLSLALGPDRRIARLVATGGVRASGPRGEEAVGETFTWDAATSRAALSGAPYVRVESRGSTIRASGMIHDRRAERTEFAGPGLIELPPGPADRSDKSP